MTSGLPRARPGRWLDVAWICLIGVTAIGHVTGLRNALAIVVPLATLGHVAGDWRTLPCKRVVGLLIVWASASLLWSAAPDVTASKLRTDLWLPALAGAAAFLLVRRTGDLRPLVVGLSLGIVVLALFSAFAYLPPLGIAAAIPFEQSAGIVRPLPHWYPGPGDASMYAILCIAPLVLAHGLYPRLRGLVRTAGALLAFVLITTNNRNGVVIAPLLLVFQWLLDRGADRRSAGTSSEAAAKPRLRRIVAGVVAAAIVAAALATVLEWGARERLAYLHAPSNRGSATMALIEHDTRPAIWRYYIVRGLQHPWIGLGFGRTVPGIGWQTASDRALARIEPNAYIHAHNILINWWLELGLVGLVLLGSVGVSLVVRSRAWLRTAGDTAEAGRIRNALLTTMMAGLARDLTDDFLVYGMAIAFVVILASLLGALARRASAPPPGPTDRDVVTSHHSP